MNCSPTCKDLTITKATGYFSEGYHCSEAVTRALLEALYGEADPACIRIATPFRGGMARTKKNACGALSGGLMVLGYRYGRILADEDDSQCVALARELYDSFEATCGYDTVNCQTLYDHRENNSCNTYVATATRLVLEIIERQEMNTPIS